MAHNVQKVSLQLNRIERIPLHSLSGLTNITELYLSENGLTELGGISGLVTLRILDVAQNRLTTFDGIETLTGLEEFWANNNNISDWKEVERIALCPRINTVYLECNPIGGKSFTKESVAEYRKRVLSILPNLIQLDASLVTH